MQKRTRPPSPSLSLSIYLSLFFSLSVSLYLSPSLFLSLFFSFSLFLFFSFSFLCFNYFHFFLVTSLLFEMAAMPFPCNSHYLQFLYCFSINWELVVTPTKEHLNIQNSNSLKKIVLEKSSFQELVLKVPKKKPSFLFFYEIKYKLFWTEATNWSYLHLRVQIG